MFQWWGDAEHQGQQLPSPPAETAGTYSVFIPCDLALSYQYSECAHASTVDWVQSMKSELKPRPLSRSPLSGICGWFQWLQDLLPPLLLHVLN